MDKPLINRMRLTATELDNLQSEHIQSCRWCTVWEPGHCASEATSEAQLRKCLTVLIEHRHEWGTVSGILTMMDHAGMKLWPTCPVGPACGIGGTSKP